MEPKNYLEVMWYGEDGSSGERFETNQIEEARQRARELRDASEPNVRLVVVSMVPIPFD